MFFVATCLKKNYRCTEHRNSCENPENQLQKIFNRIYHLQAFNAAYLEGYLAIVILVAAKL